MGLTGKYLYGYDAATRTQTKVPLYYMAEDCADWSDIQMKLPAPYTDYGYVYAPADLASNVANLETAYPGTAKVVHKDISNCKIEGADKWGQVYGFIKLLTPGNVSDVTVYTYDGYYYSNAYYSESRHLDGANGVVWEDIFTLPQTTYVSYDVTLHFQYDGHPHCHAGCGVVIDNNLYYRFQENNYSGRYDKIYIASGTIKMNAGTHTIYIVGSAGGGASDPSYWYGKTLDIEITNHRSVIIPSNIHFTKNSQEYIFLSGKSN